MQLSIGKTTTASASAASGMLRAPSSGMISSRMTTTMTKLTRSDLETDFTSQNGRIGGDFIDDDDEEEDRRRRLDDDGDRNLDGSASPPNDELLSSPLSKKMKTTGGTTGSALFQNGTKPFLL